MKDQPEATERHPQDPRRPAYNAVYALIRTLPPVANPAARNALIWRAATAALDGARVGHCVSSHCVEGDHVLMSRAEYDESRALPALLRTPEPDRTDVQAEPVRPVWIDGDPAMEAIAAAVWEQCHTQGTVVADDPRNIAAVAVAAVRTAGQPADRAALRDRIAAAIRDQVRFRFGASVLALAQQGRPIKMTPGEAEAAADAVMAVADVEQAELRTQNTRMRHELEVMYGGAFDNPPTAAPTDWVDGHPQLEALGDDNGPAAAEEANVDAVLAVLPEPTDRRAAAALAEVRRLCEMTINGSVRVAAIEQAHDTLAAIDRVMAAAEEQQPTAEDDTSRSVEAEGETIRVRGSGDITDEERGFVAEVVRAARRKYEAEHAQPAAREPDARCEVTFVGGGRCAQPAGHSDGLHMPLETLRKHERRVRWEAAARAAKRSADRAAALRIYMAAADEEQLALRAELEAMASVDADRCAALDRVREFAADIDDPAWRAPGIEVAARIRLALNPSHEDLNDRP
ncbi:hypothetical protein [Streptomyces sp. NPDC057617]|uniref:hypothetical protein n=1 Tax=Streptomyces sp. NPDC057617 TaxID=3346184 RepID=UPI0036BBF89C